MHVAGRMDEAIALAVDLAEAGADDVGRHRRGHHRFGGLRRRRPLADRPGARHDRAAATGPADRSAADPSRRPTAPRRPYDPERGLRGVMSATLVLEAITVLLSIPVAANTGAGVGAGRCDRHLRARRAADRGAARSSRGRTRCR